MKNSDLVIATILVAAALVVSLINPYDRLTWTLEVFPIFIVFPILWLTRRTFPLTRMLYVLITLHALVLIWGGAYTYARVPLGFWMEQLFHWHRNNYDKIGHFFQGFVPTLAAREILLRGSHLKKGKMLVFVVICIAMAISACYELVEWVSAISLGQGADEFLGTQGDNWDTQEDMFSALVGSILAVSLFSKLHDRALGKMERNPSAT